METKKLTKKQLKGLITQTFEQALSKLELPEATKKVRKLVSRNSERLAEEFNDLMKKAEKKEKKARKAVAYVEDVLTGKGKKKSKVKPKKAEKKSKKKEKEIELEQELEVVASA